MKAKKLVSLAAVITLSFSMVFTSVSADEASDKLKLMIASGEIVPGQTPDEKNVNIKKDAAIEIAKGMLENAELYEVGGVYLNPKWDSGGSTWSVDFYLRQTPGGSANVNVDADTGDILGYNAWDSYDQQKNYVATLTRNEAKAEAEEFLSGKMKLDMSDYELQQENPYDYMYKTGGIKEQVIYSFNYIRKINGIPLSNYSIYIGVDGTNGKIRSFSISKADVDMSNLPSTENILTTEQVIDKYKDSVNLALQYIASYEQIPYGPSKQKVMLAYVPTTYVNMLDAVTGQSVNYDGSTADLTRDDLKQISDNSVPLDPGAVLEDKAVTEDAAKTVAEKYRAIAEELLGAKFDDSNYYYGGQDNIWSFNWNQNTDNTNYSFNISINGKTGHINSIGLNKYTYDYEIQVKEGTAAAEVNEKYDWNQCKEKALELIKEIVPGQYGFYMDQNIEEPVLSDETKKYMREYNYAFTRIVNGVKFRDNTMSVSVNRETGEISNFYMNWSDLSFPAADGIITADKASAAYFEGIQPTLSYNIQYTYDQVTGRSMPAGAPKLVYMFNSGYNTYGNLVVDAMTGKLVDWSGKAIGIEKSAGESQLLDNWAKRSAELLLAQGIIRDRDINFDANVTRAEAVKMLSLAKGMTYYDAGQAGILSFSDVTKDDDDYYYIENAARQKIITETSGSFKGDEEITKEEFTKLLANLMGYSDIAKFSSIYKLPEGFSGVSPDMIGSVAICHVLDTLPVKDGDAFDGSAKVTFAEAVSALYKSLAFIR